MIDSGVPGRERGLVMPQWVVGAVVATLGVILMAAGPFIRDFRHEDGTPAPEGSAVLWFFICGLIVTITGIVAIFDLDALK